VDDAVIETYHYVNAAPQEHSFNDGLWGDVEDYILQMAAAERDISYGESRRGGHGKSPHGFGK
jgi:DNA/RNA endonuclease G (NUC1)